MRFLADSAGAVTDTYTYDAFGNLISRTFTGASPTPNHYLYAGEQFDEDLNLYYNRARYLDVRTGHFWIMDEFEGNEDEGLRTQMVDASGNTGQPNVTTGRLRRRP